ncbi:hypothetical protein [Clostridium estertheticum]|uniref:hypothetical protein n=1 Tax=Clostridium estertheticum TaxID=238834 RepID=UPI001CF42C40|nr:hypothetical protein [Clostridium estertheticum]MCB2357159.1 hypothetical protein [Clostridium estertheticum]WAG44048.1 hypothetical protein LL065_26220 [Clostridium estertheticum]
MIKEFDPAGIVDLSELDELANIGGSDVQAQTTPTIASFLVSVISIELTASAVTVTAACL